MLYFGRWKLISIALLCLMGLLFALPNVLPESARQALPKFMPSKTVNLGLDLQGGSYLLLEVDVDSIRAERITAMVEETRVALRKARIGYQNLQGQGQTVEVTIKDPSQTEAAEAAIREALPTTAPVAGQAPEVSVRREDNRFGLFLNDAALETAKRQAVEQSIEIVRRRIDALGTREPTIQRQGTDRIIVQVPGESDPERLKDVIGKTAKLTFQMVDESVAVTDAMAGRVPPGSVLLPSEEPAEPQVLVRRRALVGGDMLADAQATFAQDTGEAVVNFRFDNKGARRFADATTKNVGKRFAIILDGKVISAPVIREPITGGSGQISGNFTIESANDLAVLLRAGALPAPLTVEEQRTVGAELGADAVRGGIVAAIIGMIAVLAFMLISYGPLFGVAANLSLVVNMILLTGLLSMLQATLTLPGIAGIILTVGLAVDANVLVFERIREELRKGSSPVASIETGYKRTWWTIFDANITTLIATLILFNLGSGPVRGFAVTLSLGIFTSVFTAFVMSRLFIALWWRRTRPKSLSF